jgi:hypothetical protein
MIETVSDDIRFSETQPFIASINRTRGLQNATSSATAAFTSSTLISTHPANDLLRPVDYLLDNKTDKTRQQETEYTDNRLIKSLAAVTLESSASSLSGRRGRDRLQHQIQAGTRFSSRIRSQAINNTSSASLNAQNPVENQERNQRRPASIIEREDEASTTPAESFNSNKRDPETSSIQIQVRD